MTTFLEFQLVLSVLLLLFMRSTIFAMSHRRPSTLFVATATDTASINIARNMMSMYQWQELKNNDEQKVLKTVARDKCIYLWVVNQSLLSLNYVDKLFAAELQTCEITDDIADVFFVSKHAAASGTVSLTVHPIGIPHLLEAGRSGGLPGRCSPPSHHIGALYRNIIKHVVKHKWDKVFQVTLEATHHGPFVEVPTCFVEIGSSEAEWSNDNAGKIWARCLGQYFGMDTIPTASPHETTEVDTELFSSHDEFVEDCDCSEDIENNIESGIACLQIGGGHYVPKMNDISRSSPRIYVGHALATYTLQEAFETGAVNEDGTPRWRSIIQEAIDATRVSFPKSKIACYVDKRAFLSDQRNSISSILDENRITWGYSTSDVKRLLKGSDTEASSGSACASSV